MKVKITHQFFRKKSISTDNTASIVTRIWALTPENSHYYRYNFLMLHLAINAIANPPPPKRPTKQMKADLAAPLLIVPPAIQSL
jgi:hypothetical protein